MLLTDRYKHILIGLGIVALIGFTVGYFQVKGFPNQTTFRKPVQSETVNIVRQEDGDSQPMFRKIESFTLYTLCNHMEPLNLGSLQGMTVNELRRKFPPDQGFTIEDTGDSIVLLKRVDALCPTDAAKTHLGEFGKYVAVITGPFGYDGEVVEVTNIKISDLPAGFWEEVRTGTLNFPDAQRMLEALDSLDEYEGRAP